MCSFIIITVTTIIIIIIIGLSGNLRVTSVRFRGRGLHC
jgi:hypothetical protein